MRLEVDLEFTAMQFEDLPDLEWSGESFHLRTLAEALTRPEEIALVVASIQAGRERRMIACGAADFTNVAGSGELTMLSVHPGWQNLGVGSAMISELEAVVAGRGLGEARISAEHDNARAFALYRRLGYRPERNQVASWSIGSGRRYVTVVSTLLKLLGSSERRSDVADTRVGP